MRVVIDAYFSKHAQRITCVACTSILDVLPTDARYSHEHGHHVLCPCCQSPTPSPFQPCT